MALIQTTLGSQLANMAAVDNEIDAINNFATAFENYFYGASVAGVPATAGTLATAITALKAAMTGLSTSGNAATAIQSGIQAFWTTILPLGATIWIVVPAIILVTQPPGLGGISSAVQSAFTSNTSGKLDLTNSANAVAAAIHPTQLGGIATLGPPPPGGTPTPIL